MRLYICTIIIESNRDKYVYTPEIKDSHSWNTEQEAQNYLRRPVESGETICHSPFTKVSGVCTDFRVEPRPQGGFAISCESNI